MDIQFTESGFLLKFDMIGTVVIGLSSLYIGKLIKKHSRFLDRFGIPAAVLGGLIFAILHLFLRVSKIASIEYTSTLQDPFMLVFFTTIGLASSVEALKSGGKLLIAFWFLSGFMTLMQTVIGVSIAKGAGIDPLLGVLAGSVSMSGGHGSASAFGKTVEELGISGAAAMALSSATFGLVAGGILGSPLATSLIRKFNLKPKNVVSKESVQEKKLESSKSITSDSILRHILLLAMLITLGILISGSIKKIFNISLPSYVGAMLCAIIFNNINVKTNLFELDRNLSDILGSASLNIFLSMALISLRLWELADLVLPMLVILFVQVLFIWVYTRFIVFKAMGADYDAAVIVSGMCGSGLGATSNAMINMGEVSEKYGYTLTPYIVVPLTGAFLIDMFQIPIIITAINIFK